MDKNKILKTIIIVGAIIIGLIILGVLVWYFIYRGNDITRHRNAVSSLKQRQLNNIYNGYGERYLKRKDYTSVDINKEPKQNETPNFIENNNLSGRIVDYTNYNGSGDKNNISQKLNKLKEKLKNFDSNLSSDHHLITGEHDNRYKVKTKDGIIDNITDGARTLMPTIIDNVENIVDNYTTNEVTPDQYYNNINNHYNQNTNIYEPDKNIVDNYTTNEVTPDQYYNNINNHYNRNTNIYEPDTSALDYSNSQIHLNQNSSLNNFYNENIYPEPEIIENNIVYDSNQLKCNNKYKIINEDDIYNRNHDITGFRYMSYNEQDNDQIYPEEIETDFIYNNSMMKLNSYNPLKNASGTIY